MQEQKENSLGQNGEFYLHVLVIHKIDAIILCDEQRLRPEKSEVNRLLGCNKKICSLTEWKPQYSFEEGLAETVEFLRANRTRYKADIYNI